MSRLVAILANIGIWLFAIVPFGLLYVLSDILYILVYRLVGYRKRVVRTNLKKSFPEKTEQELLAIEKKFYHYFCDYILEGLKTLSLPKKELLRRIRFHNKEQYLEMVEKYGGIVLMLPHYANFEWIVAMGSLMKEGDVPMQVYKPIRNKYIDDIFKRTRSRFGGYNVPKHDTIREVIKAKKAGKKLALGLVADQSPNINGLNFWTTFLHQETSFMDGGERIARMMGYPVFYCEILKEKRGYCDVTFELMTELPKQTSEGEITEMFARKVEQTIIREPGYWFWSHKRWKHKPQK